MFYVNGHSSIANLCVTMFVSSPGEKSTIPSDGKTLPRAVPGSSKFVIGVGPVNDENLQSYKIQVAVNRYNNTSLPPFRQFPLSACKGNFVKSPHTKCGNSAGTSRDDISNMVQSSSGISNLPSSRKIRTDGNSNGNGVSSCEGSIYSSFPRFIPFKQHIMPKIEGPLLQKPTSSPALRYTGAEHFPTCHIYKSPNQHRKKQNILSHLNAHGVGVPVARYLDDTAEKYSDLKSTRSVLDVLQDMSRKRIHGKDDIDDVTKRRCKGLGGDLVQEGEVHYKPLFLPKGRSALLQRKDQTTQTASSSQKTSSNTMPADPKFELRKKLARKNNEFTASLSSSARGFVFTKRKRALESVNATNGDSIVEDEIVAKKKRFSDSKRTSPSTTLDTPTSRKARKSFSVETSPISPKNKDRLMSIYLDLQNESNAKLNAIKDINTDPGVTQFVRPVGCHDQSDGAALRSKEETAKFAVGFLATAGAANGNLANYTTAPLSLTNGGALIGAVTASSDNQANINTATAVGTSLSPAISLAISAESSKTLTNTTLPQTSVTASISTPLTAPVKPQDKDTTPKFQFTGGSSPTVSVLPSTPERSGLGSESSAIKPDLTFGTKTEPPLKAVPFSPGNSSEPASGTTPTFSIGSPIKKTLEAPTMSVVTPFSFGSPKPTTISDAPFSFGLSPSGNTKPKASFTAPTNADPLNFNFDVPKTVAKETLFPAYKEGSNSQATSSTVSFSFGEKPLGSGTVMFGTSPVPSTTSSPATHISTSVPAAISGEKAGGVSPIKWQLGSSNNNTLCNGITSNVSNSSSSVTTAVASSASSTDQKQNSVFDRLGSPVGNKPFAFGKTGSTSEFAGSVVSTQPQPSTTATTGSQEGAPGSFSFGQSQAETTAVASPFKFGEESAKSSTTTSATPDNIFGSFVAKPTSTSSAPPPSYATQFEVSTTTSSNGLPIISSLVASTSSSSLTSSPSTFTFGQTSSSDGKAPSASHALGQPPPTFGSTTATQGLVTVASTPTFSFGKAPLTTFGGTPTTTSETIGVFAFGNNGPSAISTTSSAFTAPESIKTASLGFGASSAQQQPSMPGFGQSSGIFGQSPAPTSTTSITSAASPAFTFGKGSSIGSTPFAFGKAAASSMNLLGSGAEINTPSFGAAVTTASNMFGTGASMTTTGFGTAVTTSGKMFGNGPAISSAFGPAVTTSTSMFGTGTPLVTPAFGMPVATSTSMFGNAPAFAATVTTSANVFGTAAALATSAFGSGAAPSTNLFAAGAPLNTSTFGTAVTSSTTLFGSGRPAITPAFGPAVTSSGSMFGTGSSITTPGFGTTVTTSATMFGAGTSVTMPAFAAAVTTSASLFGSGSLITTPAFGTPVTTTTTMFGTGTATPAFGASATSPAPMFGTGTAISSPAFNTSTTSPFGSSVARAPFGSTPGSTASAPTKSLFTFGSGQANKQAPSVFNFGTPAAPVPSQNTPFAFGSGGGGVVNLPSTGFNFNAGSTSTGNAFSFGATSNTAGVGFGQTPTPTFGQTPTVGSGGFTSFAATPSSTFVPGSFSIGSGSSQTRSRAVVRSRRR